MPEQTTHRRIYLAGPLFGIAERRFNRELTAAVARELPGIEFLLPQNNSFEGADAAPDYAAIYRFCLDGIEQADGVLAVLDGSDSDSGTALEVGFAFGLGKPVVGVRTDYRPNQERGVNLMLAHACAVFVSRPSFDEDVERLAKDVARALKKALIRPAAGSAPRRQ